MSCVRTEREKGDGPLRVSGSVLQKRLSETAPRSSTRMAGEGATFGGVRDSESETGRWPRKRSRRKASGTIWTTWKDGRAKNSGAMEAIKALTSKSLFKVSIAPCEAVFSCVNVLTIITCVVSPPSPPSARGLLEPSDVRSARRDSRDAASPCRSVLGDRESGCGCVCDGGGVALSSGDCGASRDERTRGSDKREDACLERGDVDEEEEEEEEGG